MSDRSSGPFQKVQNVLLLHGTSGTRSWFRFRISHQQSVNSLHRASDWADGASSSPDGARRNQTSFIKMKLKTSLTHFPSLNSVNDSGGSESREEGEKRGREEGRGGGGREEGGVEELQALAAALQEVSNMPDWSCCWD